MTANTDELAPGARLEHYEILGKLGEGGFATVYRARVVGSATELALKVSHGAVGLQEGAERALREVDVLCTLTNQHVVRIHAAGIAKGGHVYIAMELLRGHQLDRAHDLDRPLPAVDALRVMHQACVGLAEAHALGIVHRDLKPENLWVEPDGNVKVIDFGLARAWNVLSGIGRNVTIGQYLVGTPHYMQPEQLQTQRLTPAGDVYSLATILYELITGHAVYFDDAPLSEVRERYRNDPALWIAAHAQHEPVPLSRHAVCRDLPASVADLIGRCLAKDPEQRPADAGAVSVELGTILHYDYGVLAGAIVRIVHPYGATDERLLLPGTHRIGTDRRCEIQLASPGVEEIHALLQWDGAPHRPHLRPMTHHGAVLVDGQPIDRTAELDAGARAQIGPYGLEFVDARPSP